VCCLLPGNKTFYFLGFDSDLTMTNIGKMILLDRDGVHLNVRANNCAAASLCDRFRVRMGRWWSTVGLKKRRTEN
jgi:hypothetical protein